MTPRKKNPAATEAEVAEAVAPEAEVEIATAEVAQTAGMVRITVLEDIAPPPVVGKYNFAIEHNVTKLEAKKIYRVPRDVGLRLQDTGTVVVLEDNG